MTDVRYETDQVNPDVRSPVQYNNGAFSRLQSWENMYRKPHCLGERLAKTSIPHALATNIQEDGESDRPEIKINKEYTSVTISDPHIIKEYSTSPPHAVAKARSRDYQAQ